jgi:prophage antirepressor-like protein
LFDNKEWFVAKDIAFLLGYKDTVNAIKQHCKKSEKLSVLVGGGEMPPLDPQIKLIPESDIWRLIIKSRLPEAEKIEEWIMGKVLPQIRKTGAYSLDSKIIREISRKEEVETQLLGLEFTFKHLRPSDASKILMTQTLFKELDLKISYLPKYSDEEHTFSAKALLEKFGVKISVQQFNKKMISAGFLETKTRKSSKYRTEKDVNGKEVKIPILKEFKSLTEKGLDFGKNVISPKNQLESQPHYFEKKFSELLKTLGY